MPPLLDWATLSVFFAWPVVAGFLAASNTAAAEHFDLHYLAPKDSVGDPLSSEGPRAVHVAAGQYGSGKVPEVRCRPPSDRRLRSILVLFFALFHFKSQL